MAPTTFGRSRQARSLGPRDLGVDCGQEAARLVRRQLPRQALYQFVQVLRSTLTPRLPSFAGLVRVL